VIQPTEDDVRQLRREGDFSGYLRSLIRHTAPKAAARDGPATGYGPHHIPGAWPHSTHPPTSQICRPTCPCATPPPA
jgi:hypothetical protein